MSWLYQPLLPGGAQQQSGAGVDDLTAEDCTSGTPTCGTATLGQAHALTAASISSGTPSCGSPGPMATVTTTGAGAFTPAEIAAHKARQRRFLASLPAAKLSPDEAMLLARLIAEMRNLQSLPPREEEPEIAAEVEEAVTETLAKPEVRKAVASALVSFTPAPMPDGNSLAGEIEGLRATVAKMIAAREEAEEDDLEALLLLAA